MRHVGGGKPTEGEKAGSVVSAHSCACLKIREKNHQEELLNDDEREGAGLRCRMKKMLLDNLGWCELVGGVRD